MSLEEVFEKHTDVLYIIEEHFLDWDSAPSDVRTLVVRGMMSTTEPERRAALDYYESARERARRSA